MVEVVESAADSSDLLSFLSLALSFFVSLPFFLSHPTDTFVSSPSSAPVSFVSSTEPCLLLFLSRRFLCLPRPVSLAHPPFPVASTTPSSSSHPSEPELVFAIKKIPRRGPI